MSLEKTLERIADALEAIAAKGTTQGQIIVDAKQTAARTEKAAAAAKPVKAAEPKKEEAKTESDEEVGKVIGALLSANLKDAAIELLGTFGAKSKSTLKPADYAAFVKAGNELLVNA